MIDEECGEIENFDDDDSLDILANVSRNQHARPPLPDIPEAVVKEDPMPHSLFSFLGRTLDDPAEDEFMDDKIDPWERMQLNTSFEEIRIRMEEPEPPSASPITANRSIIATNQRSTASRSDETNQKSGKRKLLSQAETDPPARPISRSSIVGCYDEGPAILPPRNRRKTNCDMNRNQRKEGNRRETVVTVHSRALRTRTESPVAGPSGINKRKISSSKSD